MSRYRSVPAYSFALRCVGQDEFEIYWTVDFYYATSRLWYPRRFRRLTDWQGACRFARKHNLAIPARAGDEVAA